MDIKLAYADDWMGVYIDGKCVYQNHSIDEGRLLELIGIDYEYKYADGQAFEDGQFPEDWDKVISDDDWNSGVGRSFV